MDSSSWVELQEYADYSSSNENFIKVDYLNTTDNKAEKIWTSLTVSM
jgi:hypothetical protein